MGNQRHGFGPATLRWLALNPRSGRTPADRATRPVRPTSRMQTLHSHAGRGAFEPTIVPFAIRPILGEMTQRILTSA
jgi:hypothetical protein